MHFTFLKKCEKRKEKKRKGKGRVRRTDECGKVVSSEQVKTENSSIRKCNLI